MPNLKDISGLRSSTVRTSSMAAEQKWTKADKYEQTTVSSSRDLHSV